MLIYGIKKSDYQKLLAGQREPFALEKLGTEKWVIKWNGQIRE